MIKDNEWSIIKFCFYIPDETLEIIVRDSNVRCVDLVFVADKYQNLQKLVMTRSHLEVLKNCKSLVVSDSESDARQSETVQSLNSKPSTNNHLEILDLSLNKLTKIEKIILDQFPVLKELNLSGNAIDAIDSNLFSSLPLLKVLDLSSNKLNHHVDPNAFLNLPTNFHRIDISGKTLIEIFDDKENDIFLKT